METVINRTWDLTFQVFDDKLLDGTGFTLVQAGRGSVESVVAGHRAKVRAQILRTVLAPQRAQILSIDVHRVVLIHFDYYAITCVHGTETRIESIISES